MGGFPIAPQPPFGRSIRNLNRRNSALQRLLVSVDLSSDEIFATGDRLSFAPQTHFGEHSNVEGFPQRYKMVYGGLYETKQ